jgi:hypothetical protein
VGVGSGRSTTGNRLSRIMARWRGVRAAGTAWAGTMVATKLYSVHTLWV